MRKVREEREGRAGCWSMLQPIFPSRHPFDAPSASQTSCHPPYLLSPVLTQNNSHLSPTLTYFHSFSHTCIFCHSFCHQFSSTFASCRPCSYIIKQPLVSNLHLLSFIFAPFYLISLFHPLLALVIHFHPYQTPPT